MRANELDDGRAPMPGGSARLSTSGVLEGIERRAKQCAIRGDRLPLRLVNGMPSAAVTASRGARKSSWKPVLGNLLEEEGSVAADAATETHQQVVLKLRLDPMRVGRRLTARALSSQPSIPEEDEEAEEAAIAAAEPVGGEENVWGEEVEMRRVVRLAEQLTARGWFGAQSGGGLLPASPMSDASLSSPSPTSSQGSSELPSPMSERPASP